jgi:ATP-dependent DNA helicase RecG
MLQTTPIDSLPATSPVTIKKLKALDVTTFWDLLNYFPFRYEDFSIVSPIATIQEGETVSLKGELVSITQLVTRRGFRIQKGVLKDTTGKVDLIWYNQKFLLSTLKPGMFLGVSGLVKKFGKVFSVQPTSYEILQDLNQETKHVGRIVPVYSEHFGLSSKTIREKVAHIIKNYQLLITNYEFLPQDIVEENGMISETEAYRQVHFPSTMKEAQEARKRLAFDELFTIQLSAALVRKEWEKETVTHAFSIQEHNNLLQTFIHNLPFQLTNAQKRVSDEILEDLAQTKPMNRFVQGDVGSGKTVIAAIAAYMTHLNGYQTLFMAPTEILAQQHYATISKLMEPYGIKIGIQTGSRKSIKDKRSSTLQTFDFIDSSFDILIGTHALLTESVQLDKVGLVIIDEQHRFGVAQRAILKQKGSNPHLLTMTATPIPRTVALTMYGELDLSIIDEMPKGRLPIKTHLTPHNKRIDGYEWIKQQMKQDGIQVYVICPLIEESDGETMQTVKAATKEYEDLKKIFKDYNVALLHGKMKPAEKDVTMKEFKEKKYDILVSTSVVEVGIDVPNATIMIIEGAERFGLAQLHQLRGRVGRGDKQSYCFLFTSTEDVQNTHRLNFFCRTNSGMALAEYDLKVRGPGQMYGKVQSGYDDLKIASFSDFPLISQSKHAVDDFIKKYSVNDFPKILQRIAKYQIKQISRD